MKILWAYIIIVAPKWANFCAKLDNIFMSVQKDFTNWYTLLTNPPWNFCVCEQLL